MKRLAVLLLVLSVASLAQASFFLTVDGQTVSGTVTVTVGQPVAVGVWSTDTALVPEPTIDEPGGNMYHTLTVGAFTSAFAPGYATLTNPVIKSAAGASAVTGVFGLSPWLNNEIVNNGWSVQNPTDLSAGQWFEWTYTPQALGAGFLDLFSWDSGYNGTFYQVINMNTIPEPTTMTLLGLGLVALFRKK